MSAQNARATVGGLLPKNDERPPWFAFVVSLYKSDLLFRSLVDIAVSGVVILAFAGALGSLMTPVGSAMRSAISVFQTPTSKLRADGTARFATHDEGPGRETILAIQPPQISERVVDKAAPSNAVALNQARELLKDGNPQGALAALSSADDEDPVVPFAKAAATLHLRGNGRALEALRLLRSATEKAFAPAFTLYGLVLFQLVVLHERGDLPASESMSLDGAGRPVEMTPEQLAAEAVQWWQRGAAFHDPEAMRLLGMAEARGFGGKRNLAGAIAHWRDAAARGDAFARFELGQLYFQGAGIEADSEKGLDLMRQASDQGLLRASLALGSALMAKSMAGSADAAREAIGLLDRVAKKGARGEERSFAHLVLGHYLSESAPPALRDPARAVDHFRFAARAGAGSALRSLARAYANGVGVDVDRVKAAGYLMLLRRADPEWAEAELAKIAKHLTADEMERAKAFKLSSDPATPAFVAEYEVREKGPGLFKAVNSSLRPRAEPSHAPQPSAR